MTKSEKSLGKYIWVVALSVALITFLVYIPALQNDFVNWDDPDYVQNNPHIRNINMRFLGWMFTNFHVSIWHPLTWFSHAVDYALWGLNPVGHHLTNIVLHSMNTFLVVLLAVGVVRRGRVQESDTDRNDIVSSDLSLLVGLVAGLLFGLHPLHVESVAWISERKDVLYSFFYLFSLLMYLRYTATATQRRFAYYSLCLLSFALSLLSKPMAITLPVVLIIMDVYPLRRLALRSAFTIHRKILMEKVPFFALSLVSAVLTIYGHRLHEALAPLDVYSHASPLLVAMRAYAFYIVKMVLPFGLTHLYPYPEEISFFSFEYVAYLLLLVGITSICLFMLLRKRNKVWITAWAYYAVTLFPVSGIMEIGKHAAADRYTYLPILGPFVLVALGIAFMWRKFSPYVHTVPWKKVYFVLPVVFIMVLMIILTIQQIAVWRNSIELWSRTISFFPDFYYSYYCRGTSYMKHGQYDEAIKDFNTTLLLNPSYAKAYNNLGATYGDVKDYDRALENYRKSIELDPEYAVAYYNLANVYLKLDNHQSAMYNFTMAIKRDPSFTIAYKKRGDAFMALGKYDQAINDFNRAVELEPSDVEIYSKRGMAYFQMKNLDQAIGNFLSIINVEPLNYQALTNLGTIYAESGEFKRAISYFTKALEIYPEERSIYFNRGLTYMSMNKRQEAIRDFQAAARMGDTGAQNYLKAEDIGW